MLYRQKQVWKFFLFLIDFVIYSALNQKNEILFLHQQKRLQQCALSDVTAVQTIGSLWVFDQTSRPKQTVFPSSDAIDLFCCSSVWFCNLCHSVKVLVKETYSQNLQVKKWREFWSYKFISNNLTRLPSSVTKNLQKSQYQIVHRIPKRKNIIMTLDYIVNLGFCAYM